MSQDYKCLNHSVNLLNYHFVWIPKRRKKVLVGPIAERLQALLHQKCKELGLEIIAFESCSPLGIQSDHVHLFINSLPKFAPCEIAFLLKGYTSRMIRAEFPKVTYLRSLWTSSYFVSTAGNVSSETVRRYIEGHNTR